MKKLTVWALLATLVITGSALAAGPPLHPTEADYTRIAQEWEKRTGVNPNTLGVFDEAMKATATRHITANLTAPFPDQFVIVANEDATNWKTDLNIDGHWSVSSTVPLTNCCYPIKAEVPANGVKIIKDWGGLVAFYNPVQLFNAGPVAATLSSTMHFNDGASRMTLTFPSFNGDISLDTGGELFRAGPIANDGETTTFLLLFNYGDKADLAIKVYNASNAYVAREEITIDQHGWAFYPLKTQIAEGSIQVRAGTGDIIISPPWPDRVGRVFGVAVTGTKDGAEAPRVIPLAPLQVAPAPTTP